MPDYQSEPVDQVKQNANKFRARISRSTIIPTKRNSIKSELEKGTPLPFGMDVDERFEDKAFHFVRADGAKIWDRYGGNSRDGHAMLLIGWDDSRRAYEVLNSYGPNWGDDQGYLWIDYDFFERNAVVVYSCTLPYRAGTAVAVSGTPSGASISMLPQLLGYCRVATRDETTGKFGTFYFNVSPEDLVQGNIAPGTVTTVKETVEAVSLRPGMTIHTSKGLSLAEPVIGYLHSGDKFRITELKAFTIKKGTETHYWVGGEAIRRTGLE